MPSPAISIADDDMPEWRKEILANYLADTQKEHSAGGHDSDEAMSTDSSEFEDEGDFEGDSLSAAPSSSISTAFSSMALYDATQPADIASDDSAFSSEDEFAAEDDGVREQQRTRRLLALGRAPPALLLLRHRALTDMHEAYMKQLNDADVELAELTGGAPQTVAQRATTLDYRAPVDLRGPDVAAIVRELRMRSQKEIAEVEKPDSIRGLVLLAQALFRKEREIKRIMRERMREESDEDEDEDM